ncbi:MAG TPA: cupredoxin domain-containing protein [Acidimicrobiia bacterium]|nr:cupredoxin domain-containing protein [Acidimicrobiia bacterium]
MLDALYQRVLRPLAIPLVAIGVIVFVVLDLSRAELALAGPGAAITAAVLAAGILFGAARLARRDDGGTVRARRFVVGGGLLLVLGGLVGLARLDEQKTRAAHAREAREQNEGPLNATITAYDIGFREPDVTVPAGRVRIGLVDEGRLPHTLVIEGVPSFKRLEVVGQGDRVTETFTIAPGTYTFYCDVPGHRQAGMHGVITAK